MKRLVVSVRMLQGCGGVKLRKGNCVSSKAHGHILYVSVCCVCVYIWVYVVCVCDWRICEIYNGQHCHGNSVSRLHHVGCPVHLEHTSFLSLKHTHTHTRGCCSLSLSFSLSLVCCPLHSVIVLSLCLSLLSSLTTRLYLSFVVFDSISNSLVLAG